MVFRKYDFDIYYYVKGMLGIVQVSKNCVRLHSVLKNTQESASESFIRENSDLFPALKKYQVKFIYILTKVLC